MSALGVIGGIAGSLISSIGGAISNSNSSSRQYKYNRLLMQYQSQLNQASTDRANAYNSPSAVMDRLKSAGLNPNLALGSVSGGLSDTLSTSGSSVGIGENVGMNASEGFSSVLNSFSQASGVASQKGLNDASIANLSMATEGLRSVYGAQVRNLDSLSELNAVQLGQIVAQTDLLKQELANSVTLLYELKQRLGTLPSDELNTILDKASNPEAFKKLSGVSSLSVDEIKQNIKLIKAYINQQNASTSNLQLENGILRFKSRGRSDASDILDDLKSSGAAGRVLSTIINLILNYNLD